MTVFRPNAVLIPSEGKEGKDFDPADCTLLMADGDHSFAEVYTREAWESKGCPSYIQERGDFFLPDGSEAKVQLLPDTCIVKIPDREYWCEEVQARTKRIFAVYAFDRRQQFYLCELCASYELHFIEHQYEATDEVDENDDKRDELYEAILDGGRFEEPVIYEHRKEIDRMLLRRCRPGWLPKGDGGGYRLRGMTAVTWEGVMEEIWAMQANGNI